MPFVVSLTNELLVTEDDLKKKWRSLRDCYHKHLRSKFTSPSDGRYKLLYRYKYWPWAQKMTVFKPYFVQTAKKIALVRGTKGKILTLPDSEVSEPETLHDNEPEPSNIPKPISREPTHTSKATSPEPTHTSKPSSPEPTFIPKFNSPKPTQPKKLKYGHPVVLVKKVNREKETSETCSQVTKEKTNEKKVVENKIEQNKDDIDLLFLSYAKTVKKLSEERQVITKFKISQLLMQQELAQLKDNAGDSTSTEIALDPIIIAEKLPEVTKYELDSDEEDVSN